MCALSAVRAVVLQGAAEDPLDNEEQLQDQLDSLPYLCRFQYAETAEYLVGLTDPLVAAYQAFSSGMAAGGSRGSGWQGRGAWWALCTLRLASERLILHRPLLLGGVCDHAGWAAPPALLSQART